MSGRERGRRRERGIALLTAILLVALATILATSLGYKTVLEARRGAGALALGQSILAAEAAEALAAYALRESRQMNPQYDAPGEPWSIPYGPMQLSVGVTVQGSLEDLEGRFNLNNLVDGSGQINPIELEAFEHLLAIVGLNNKWAPMIAEWIDANVGAQDETYLSQSPPYRTASRQITSTSELLALPGFGAARFAKIAPYVTALPQSTPVNVCTASGPVLDALGPPAMSQYSALTPKQLAAERTGGCFPSLQEYLAAFGGQAATNIAATQPGAVSTQSSYFLLTTQVDIGSEEFYLYSVLFGQGMSPVRIIARRFTRN